MFGEKKTSVVLYSMWNLIVSDFCRLKTFVVSNLDKSDYAIGLKNMKTSHNKSMLYFWLSINFTVI